MLFFKTRELARTFANKSNKKVTDLGSESEKRWGVKVVKH